MKINLISLLTLSIVAFSCSEQFQENPNYKTITASKFTLQQKGEFIIEIDSLTPYYSNCIQFIESDSKSRLMTFNAFRSTIDFYSFDTKQLIKRLDLNYTKIKNPGDFDGVFVINPDSILAASSTKGRMILVDSAGIILREYSIPPNDSNNFFASPTISTTNPAIKKGDKISISGLLGPKIDPFSEISETQIQNLNLTLDLKTGLYSADLAYPSSYVGKFWGGNMMMFYRTFNDNLQSCVYSFPADHNVLITNLGKDKKEILGSTSFFNQIRSMKKSELSAEGRRLYYLKTPSYGPIIYDKYKNVYYRIAYQAITDEDFDSKDIDRSEIKHASIIILDEQFNFLGETLLPRFSYTETMYFVNELGLYLGKWEKSKLNENLLVFELFQLKKNEKNI